MGKIELPHLLEFLFKCYGLANWAPFVKFVPILDVEAGTTGEPALAEQAGMG